MRGEAISMSASDTVLGACVHMVMQGLTASVLPIVSPRGAVDDSRQCSLRAPNLIGTIRRECLDFVIPLNERHLRSVLTEWVTRTTIMAGHTRAWDQAFRIRRWIGVKWGHTGIEFLPVTKWSGRRRWEGCITSTD
jgi:hypothetical protein